MNGCEPKKAKYQRSENPWGGKLSDCAALNDRMTTMAIGSIRKT